MKIERFANFVMVSTNSHKETLSSYIVTTRHQSEEEMELEKNQFTANPRTIREYVEYHAQLNWPEHEFHWTKEKDSYNSKPFEGESIMIQLEKGYTPSLPIEAVIFRREKKPDRK